MATRKPLKYPCTVKTHERTQPLSCPLPLAIQHAIMPPTQGLKVGLAIIRRHLRFKLCSSQFLDGDPTHFFWSGRHGVLSYLAEKVAFFSSRLLPVSSKAPHHPKLILWFLKLGWISQAFGLWTSGMLERLWRRAPAFSLEGWPIKCQWPVSCLRIYRCETGSKQDLTRASPWTRGKFVSRCFQQVH